VGYSLGMPNEQENRDLAARRRLRAMTPAERLEVFMRIQQTCMLELRSSPKDWQRFLRRNISQRAIPESPNAYPPPG
jgi:hypothetical protein